MFYGKIIIVDGVYRRYTLTEKGSLLIERYFNNGSFCYFGKCRRLGGNIPVYEKFPGLSEELYRIKNEVPSAPFTA